LLFSGWQRSHDLSSRWKTYGVSERVKGGVFLLLFKLIFFIFVIQDHIENRCNSRLPCFPWIEANYNRSPAFELLPFENSDSPAWQQLSIEEKYKKAGETKIGKQNNLF
jgi:hypothetical protein